MSGTHSPSRAKSPPYSRFVTRDFDELAGALDGIDAGLRQLSGGRFHGETETVALGRVWVMRTVVNRAVLARGAVRPGVTLFSPITPACEGARWRGRLRRHGEINVNRPSSEIDHLTGPAYDSLTIIIDTDRLLDAGEALLRAEVGPLLAWQRGYRPDPQAFASLVASARVALRRARSGLLGSETARTRAEEALIGTLLSTLAGEPALGEAAQPSNRQRVVWRAEEFMKANLRRPLLMTDLCQALGVCERTLRYAFKDCLGVSPQAYFKSIRLNEIHRQYALMRDGESVQEVARQWGFIHLGNFAADYRRLFGERPSDTARQGR